MRSSQSIRAAAILMVCLGVAALVGADITAQTLTSGVGGADQYRMYCASCHGTTGRGDGPIAASLRPPPADLTLIAARNGGQYPEELVYQIIDGRKPMKGHGRSEMPAWGDAFSRSGDDASEERIKMRIDALVKWVATLQQPRP